MTDEPQPETQEERSLHLEILERTSQLATAGFGLVAALAWNSAIQELFNKLIPSPSQLSAKFFYAAVITMIVVVITMKLGHAISRVKELDSQRRSKSTKKTKPDSASS